MSMRRSRRHSVTIIGRHWRLVLPAGAGYDGEVLLDHLNEAVQRHGNADLVSANGRFSISRASEVPKQKCSSCRSAARGLAGTHGGDVLCLRCIVRRLRTRVRRSPELALSRG
jgi:hypothetical protein